MHLTARQEQFSKAMVRAVAAVAGLNIREDDVDDDSVDMSFIAKRRQNCVISNPEIAAQLKCCKTDDGTGDILKYDLKIKNYDDLRDPNVGSPRILIVVCTPGEIGDWLHETVEATAMRRCAYWVSLRGLGPKPDQDDVRVYLPRSQVFNVASLTSMIDRVSTGQLP